MQSGLTRRSTYFFSPIFRRSSGSAVLLLPESAEGSQDFFGKFLSIFSTDETDGADDGVGRNDETQ
jgi:hypothetical protein